MRMEQLIAKARDPLNDEARERWDDASLLGFAVDGLVTIRSTRPDLFIGNWSVSFSGLQTTDECPLNDHYALAVADYVTGRANLRDEDDADGGRAEAFLKLALARIS